MPDFDDAKSPLVEAWEAYRQQPRTYAQRCEWAEVYDWCDDEAIAADFVAFYAVLQYTQTMERLHNLAKKSAEKKTTANVVH